MTTPTQNYNLPKTDVTDTIEKFRTNSNEVAEFVDALHSAADGSSGADKIGATAVKEGGAKTVQGILEELYAEGGGGGGGGGGGPISADNLVDGEINKVFTADHLNSLNRGESFDMQTIAGTMSAEIANAAYTYKPYLAKVSLETAAAMGLPEGAYYDIYYFPTIDPDYHIHHCLQFAKDLSNNSSDILWRRGAGGAWVTDWELFHQEPYTTTEKNKLALLYNSSLEIILPPKIYALAGQELNIYYDNIINGKDTEFDFSVLAYLPGQVLQNRYKLIPAEVGTKSITISAYKYNTEVAAATTDVVISSSTTGEGVTKKILIIGDSTTDNDTVSTVVQKLLENFTNDAMNIEAIGTKGTGVYKHEAKSGATIDTFTTDNADNPFWNPATQALDFSYYLTQNSLNAPDYVILNLGINDEIGAIADHNAEWAADKVIQGYNSLIACIKAHSPAIKIGVALTIPPCYWQDAFGKTYGNVYYRWRHKRNIFILDKKLINAFKNKEADGIYLVPIYTNIDTRYNYGLEENPVNARNPRTIESPAEWYTVHPDTPGYWQIADVYWFWLKSFET